MSQINSATTPHIVTLCALQVRTQICIATYAELMGMVPGFKMAIIIFILLV